MQLAFSLPIILGRVPCNSPNKVKPVRFAGVSRLPVHVSTQCPMCSQYCTALESQYHCFLTTLSSWLHPPTWHSHIHRQHEGGALGVARGVPVAEVYGHILGPGPQLVRPAVHQHLLLPPGLKEPGTGAHGEQPKGPAALGWGARAQRGDRGDRADTAAVKPP